MAIMFDLPDIASQLPGEALDDVRLLFEYETCGSCGGDYDDHKVVADPLGNPFAACNPQVVARYEAALGLPEDG